MTGTVKQLAVACVLVHKHTTPETNTLEIARFQEIRFARSPQPRGSKVRFLWLLFGGMSMY